MSNFQEGKKLFAKGDLSGSFEKLKLFLEDNFEKSSVEESIESSKLIISIAKSLNLKTSDYVDVVVKSFMKNALYRNALEILEEHVTQSRKQMKESHLKLLVECSKNIGSVKKEKLYLDELTSHYLKKGSFDQILSQDIKKLEIKFLIEAYIRTFNILGIERLIKEELLDISQLTLVTTLMSQNTTYWNKSEDIRQWLIKNLNNTYSLSINKKFVLKLFHDHLVLGGDLELSVLVDICEKWRLFALGYEVSILSKDKKREDYFLINTPNELMRDESFDFGSDLLRTKGSNENNENRLVVENQNDSMTTQGTSHNRIEDLLKEIQSLTVGRAQASKEKSLRVFIGDNEIDFLKEGYNDLIAGLNMLGEYELSRKTLEHFLDDESIGLDERIDISYLLVETLLSQRNYFEAEKVIDDVLYRYPLSKDKRITFIYLKADTYFLQGKNSNAYQYYKVVSSERPNYRLVGQRLRELKSAE